MAINRVFAGKDIKLPGGDGPLSGPCPKCKAEKLYGCFGHNPDINKFVVHKFCCVRGCNYSYNNLTKIESELIKAANIKRHGKL